MLMVHCIVAQASSFFIPQSCSTYQPDRAGYDNSRLILITWIVSHTLCYLLRFRLQLAVYLQWLYIYSIA